MEYYSRIQQALEYIEHNLDQELTMIRVAARAGFSSFHFQRIFHTISGYSVQEYIRNRRLSAAYTRLVSSRASILDIALEAGYGSQEAFTRAFAGYAGVTPAKLRRNPDAAPKPQLQQPMQFMDYIQSAGEGLIMHKPVIEELQPRVIVGRRYRTNLKDGAYFQEIPGFYFDFGSKEYFMRIANKAAPDMSYGIACDFGEEGDFSFVIGEQVADVPQSLDPDLIHMQLPGEKYAVFKADGTAEQTQQARKYIYGVWLLQSGYERREGPDFEITDVRNSRYPDHMVMSIYIPIADE
ncbi:AraC family transcriptional regulator [Paenibacillus pinistramenti]|uniref:AraC family transcriptional regulator n=1 Tax=Paenibacillus pinistramenti TaxID=1768003 RepID=UPI001109FA12|nr:AraC family transcriptional regulator [Paenibacillus pinistramenti]